MRKAGQVLKALGLTGLVGGAAAGGYALGDQTQSTYLPPQPTPEEQAQMQLIQDEQLYQILLANGVV
jgi:hypothetical protein